MSTLKSLERGELYTVGLITALAKELAAALAMLDQRHTAPNDFDKPPSDKNSYHWGRIGDHNIVIASLAAGMYGTTSAATTAIQMLSSFPNIKIGMMGGIGAGIARPMQKRDIRLGDVVVSLPEGQSGGVLQYDLMKSRVSGDQEHTTHTFERVGSLNSPPEALLKALNSLRAQARLEGSKVSSFLGDMLERYPHMAENESNEPGYIYQGQENDKLFEASYIHASDMDCDGCDSARIVPRTARRNPSVPRVHYGVIASGNKLVKDATERDLILRASGEDCICLEMEAAGLVNSFPCLVIRGICDYADSHKNDDWQEYAAATAAAYAKEFLGFVDKQDLTQTSRAIDILQDISSNINELATKIRDTGKTIQELRHDQHEKDIRVWLSAPDPSVNYTNALEKRHEGTGLWFTDGQAFSEWKKQSNSFLWLYGIPGCGKTILSSTIIQCLKTVTTETQALLYFFFDFNDTNKQTLESMLRSLVSQLYQGQPDARGPLDQLWKSSGEGDQQLSKQSLKDVLLVMLHGFNDVSIVLDALDESNTRTDLLIWLGDVFKSESFSCRILVTARREADIETTLQHWTQPQDMVNINQDDVSADIRAYINHTVRDSKELDRWHKLPEVQNEIETELVEKAGGMFRWVACQIDALKNCLDYPILQRTLRNLPKTLDETYTRILESISGEHSAQAATILSLLVWSDWRFTINELVDAIATDLDADPAFDPKNRMPVPRDVLKLCSSLVAVTQNGTNPGMEMVQLAHSSVKEYLISDHVSKTFESLSRETVARSYLARLCLRYLTGVAQITLRTRTSQLDFEEICQQFPFAKYSAQSWMEHARETEDEDDGLCKMVSSFFIEEHNGFSLFREMYDCRNSHERSPLYYAASNGWTRTIEDLLELGADVNAADGAALFAALRSDNSKTVQLSLDRGSDVNARDGRALSEASEYGYDSMIQLLLDRGADVNARDGEALLMASTRGHDMTVQLLLDRGADVDANDGEALLLASRTGNDIIVQLLLDGGADPNAQGQSKLPALQGVLMCAYQDLVNLLYKGASRATALDSALLRSYYKIAETLLGKGANIFPGGDWFYTLHADGWNDQIVRRTLERNAPLSANHLLSAMMDNDPQAKSIISVMLPYLTLEVAAARRKYWPWMNLLHYAAMCGSETVTQRCLDLGIDIDAQEDSGRTALHYAADHRCLPIVKMLVQAGSNTNLRELEDHTPLECAQVEDSFMALPTYLEEIRRQTPRWEVVDYLSEITQRTIAEPSIDQNHANRKRKRSPEDIGGTGR